MYIYKLIYHKYTILKGENSFVSYNIFVLLLGIQCRLCA